MRVIETDALVIGSGIAGCVAALEAAERGMEVLLVTAGDEPWESNTEWAQGGIIYRGKDDQPESLVQDILVAGAGASLPSAARLLAEEGPRLVDELLIGKYGVSFSYGPDGELDLTREGGHSLARIAHADDRTGHAIERALVQALREQPRVSVLPRHIAVDLLTTAHHSPDPLAIYEPLECVGAYVYEQHTGDVHTVLARATVLATGGLGRIYRHTTNPPGARGDGYAMAARTGARLVNMEYIQFHPTTLYHPSGRFLISESMRGEGAALVTADGDDFMHRYHPDGALAPRDIVARAIVNELLRRGEDCVYLDVSATGMTADSIKERFPYIYETCLQYGLDITREPIPVVPAAHYTCGGVLVDEWGCTNVHRLYAVGEVSCTGLHGANRLASTSLLEGLVWGQRAARHLADQAYDAPRRDIPHWRGEQGKVDPALIAQDEATIRQTMWNYVGLIRSRARLERASEDLARLRDTLARFYRQARLTDALLGLRNMVEAALLVAQAAWHNTESRGCHYRED